MSENNLDSSSDETNGSVKHTTSDTIKRTPLPRFQLLIVALILFSEPITATVIYPFINQIVQDTGVTRGDEKKTGYYVGLIQSAFFFAEALTVFQWGRLSDRYGRKPVLLLGPIGLAVAMMGFGLSTTYWPLIGFRCLQGVFNGTIGVSKSVIGEITDDTNMGDAFAILPLVWTSGSTISPAMGGFFTEPVKRWPGIFGKSIFFRDHPYFLPCAAASTIAFSTFLIASFALKESSPTAIAKIKRRNKSRNQSGTRLNSTSGLLDQEEGMGQYGSSANNSQGRIGPTPEIHVDSPVVPIRDLLTRRVVLTLTSTIFTVITSSSITILLPLMYSTSIPLGGLGLTPSQIGTILGTLGFTNSIVQYNCLGPAIRRFGPRKTYIASNMCLLICIGTYPVSSYFARQAGRVDWKVCFVLGVQFSFHMMKSIAYGSMNILVIKSSPTKACLGATNGLAQTLMSGARSLAPMLASSLFSISLERRLANGNMVYFVLQAIAAIAIYASFHLPK